MLPRKVSSMKFEEEVVPHASQMDFFILLYIGFQRWKCSRGSWVTRGFSLETHVVDIRVIFLGVGYPK